MASRPIFISMKEGDDLVHVRTIEFNWAPGFSVAQKQRSIRSLHEAAMLETGYKAPLEVSTKSTNSLGKKLSAFNLKGITKKEKRCFTVETLYHSSKVFENGGPYKDLLGADPKSAKRDSRLTRSGALIAFDLFGEQWPLEPKTAFYDWLYINCLSKNGDLSRGINHYDFFTDIEFNPIISVNCQAHAIALHQSLLSRGLLADALSSKERYLRIIQSDTGGAAMPEDKCQRQLF